MNKNCPKEKYRFQENLFSCFNQKGFGLILLFIPVLLIILAGLFGYTYFYANPKNPISETTVGKQITQTITPPSPTPGAVEAPIVDPEYETCLKDPKNPDCADTTYGEGDDVKPEDLMGPD